MWYLVNLPGNKLNVAVKTEKNSIAADCLNKVSFNCFVVAHESEDLPKIKLCPPSQNMVLKVNVT